MTSQQFKNIYQQYGRAIRNYVYYRSGNTAVADDIVQETFVKVWEKDLRFEPKKIKNLLYKIANNLFIDYIRRHKMETDYIENLKFTLKTHVEQTADHDVYRKKCEKALKDLTEKERTVFLMSRKDQLKYHEIAECLNISTKAVEKRMRNALQKLKNSIKR
ncbi:MAG: RNA polymerase sigma factor [Chitinophagales bacterium]